jgi:hypothetical protein
VQIAERPPQTDELVKRPERSSVRDAAFDLDRRSNRNKMTSSHRQFTLVLSLFLFFAFAVRAADDKQPIAPQDAPKHVGEEITVEMQVRAAKKSAKMKKVFLDSTDNFQDADNLGISIDEQGEKELATKFANTDLPAYFLKKTIRVKGTVVRRDDRTYIDVSLGSQLDLAPVQKE